MIVNNINALKNANIAFGLNGMSSTPSVIGNTQEYTLAGCDSPSIQMAKNALGTYSFLGVRKVFGNQQAYFYKLPNGQNVVLVPKKGTTVVKTYVNVGALNEPDNLRGISHFIEHNLFNGSKDISAGEFFKRTAKMGAETNASTSFATTDYYIASQLLDTNDFEETIKLHADMLQNPKFELSQIEKERGPVTSEIAMYRDEPDNIALNTCIKNLFNIKTTSDDIVAGTIDRINNVTKEDVQKYYDTWYTPDNFTTVITGEIEPANTMNLLSKYFTSTKKTLYENRKYEQLTPLNQSVRVDNYSERLNNSIAVIGFQGLPNNADTKEKLAFLVLNDMLANGKTSRLNKSLEKYQTNVDISSEKISNRPCDPQAILFSTSCDDSKMQDVLQEIYNQINAVCNNPPTKDEFECAKNNVKLGLDCISDYSCFLNHSIGECMLNNNTDFMMNAGIYIDSLTPEDIKNVASKYLKLDKASLSVVHPKKSDNNNNIAFGASVKKQVIDTNQVKQFTLPNNIKYTNLRSDKLKSNISVEYVDKNIPDYPAGADFILAEMLQNGSACSDKQKFYELAQKNNININFAYDNGKIISEIDAPNEKIPLAINMMKEGLFMPDFSVQNFEKSKKLVKDKITGWLKSPNDNLNKNLFPESVYGYTKEDILKSIDSIKPEQIMNLYQKTLNNSQASVSTSSPDNLSTYIMTEISTLPAVKNFDTALLKTFKPLEKNVVVSEIEQKNQAEIKQTFKFKIGQNIKDDVAFRVLNIILGGSSSSRLFQDLREKQKLAYGVGSRFSSIGDTGMITLSIGTTTDNPEESADKIQNLAKSLDGFKKHTDMLKNKLCSQEELDNAKKLFKQNLLQYNESDYEKVFTLQSAQNTPYGVDYDNKVLDVIDTLTLEDIKNTANYVFNSNSVTSVLGSEKTIKALNEYEKNI